MIQLKNEKFTSKSTRVHNETLSLLTTEPYLSHNKIESKFLSYFTSKNND